MDADANCVFTYLYARDYTKFCVDNSQGASERELGYSLHHPTQHPWATSMDANRHQADSGDKYTLDQYNMNARHTYNMDEKGFLIGITGRSKRVFSKRMWEKEVRASIQDGSREWITLLACICADGSHLPPSVTYQA